MQKMFICQNESCSQFSVEFVLTDPMPITTCGGCGALLEANELSEESADE